MEKSSDVQSCRVSPDGFFDTQTLLGDDEVSMKYHFF